MLNAASTPSVSDHAVPSEAQSTSGSDWNWSPGCAGRLDVVQVAPPSTETYCGCVAATRSLEAAITRSEL